MYFRKYFNNIRNAYLVMLRLKEEKGLFKSVLPNDLHFDI